MDPEAQHKTEISDERRARRLLALGAAAAMIFAVHSSGARTGLLPELSLDFLDLIILIITPLIAGLAARLAARVTVIRSLKSVM